ncbi:MAG: hypothetical protein IT445_06485 [Phycisphaeraceae bacterium]|nr:hypothetical protein [Phycisphaeraceae bacterium]
MSIFMALLLATPPALAEEQQDQRVEIDHAKWESAIAAFEQQDAEHPPTPGGILFLGSSSIRKWDTARCFAQREDVVNRGFGGSCVPDSTYYFDRVVLPQQPRIIVFYAGDNDIARKQPPRYVAEDFQTFADRTHQALPQTKIIYIAIKPSVSRWQLWPQMQQANKLIADICADDELLTFLDLSDTLLGEDGQPIPERFTDGLHLTEDAYDLWSTRVEAQLVNADQQKDQASP